MLARKNVYMMKQRKKLTPKTRDSLYKKKQYIDECWDGEIGFPDSDDGYSLLL